MTTILTWILCDIVLRGGLILNGHTMSIMVAMPLMQGAIDGNRVIFSVMRRESMLG
jgi:hypothetical protein